jgi:hypothetical protein
MRETLPSTPTPDDFEDEIQLARHMREETAASIEETRLLQEREWIPLWERIRMRREQNDFGREYEIALIPKWAKN